MIANIFQYFLIPAWYALLNNTGWMSWNLFLALVPLALAFWLFRKPRSLFLFWGTLLLLGATLLPHVQRVFVFGSYLFRGEERIYIAVAIAITVVLMLLDLWRFSRQRNTYPGHRFLLWWLGFFAFIAFLPNAPYVLTDIIHLYEDVRANYSVWVLTLAIVPQYLFFMLIAFEAYTLSLVYMGDYMKRQNWGKFILVAELIVHALCSIGIYLGRFLRFNSWDIVTNPNVLVSRTLDDLIAKSPLLVMGVTFITIAILYYLTKWVTLAIAYQGRESDRLESRSDNSRVL